MPGSELSASRNPKRGDDEVDRSDPHVVANLSKGRIGEDASGFVGSLLLASFQAAAYNRAMQPANDRTPFTLYVDEFPRFVTPSFAELLAEARKFGLGLVLANQHLGQLDAPLRGALLGNAGTMIAFRLGAEDAFALEPEFTPELRADDLTRLGRYEIALKLCVDGVTSAPFTGVSNAPEPTGDRQSGKPTTASSPETATRVA